MHFFRLIGRSSERGFTLIEVVLVIVIVAMLSTLVASRFETVQGWRRRAALRQLVRTWETIYNEAITQNHNYRLIFDLDNQTYFVRREVISRGFEAQQVDYLANLRTKGEQRRRAKEELESKVPLEEEFELEDARLGKALDELYYEYIYFDPGTQARLATPLSFPDLGEPTPLPEGLDVTGVKVRGEVREDGRPFIRVSAREGSEFAVVYVRTEDQEFTLLNDPGTGTFSVKPGHLDYEWTLGKDLR